MNHWKDFSTAAILAQWATGTQRIRVLLLCSFLIISSIKSGSGADFLNFLGQPLLNTDQQRLAGNWVNLDIIESYFLFPPMWICLMKKCSHSIHLRGHLKSTGIRWRRIVRVLFLVRQEYS